MHFVKTEDLKPGMRLAKPIYNRNGVMLYERNSKITSQGIISVNNFGLIGIYILEPAEPVPPMSEDDIEFERFQAMSIFEIKEILDAYSEGKKENNMYQFINQLLKKYGSLHHKINFIQNIRSNDDYVYKHSLNTAILCALISSRLGLEFKTQLDLTAAALLHDIGGLQIPNNIRRKKTILCRCHKMPTCTLVITNLNRTIKSNAVCRILIWDRVRAVILDHVDIF